MKGVILLMSTRIPGMVLIKSTRVHEYASVVERMEKSGYNNADGLREEYSVIVNGSDKKIELLKKLFKDKRIGSSDLYAIDISLIVQLLESFDGEQIYPPIPTKDSPMLSEHKVKLNWGRVPSGTYYLSENRRLGGKIDAMLEVDDGNFIVKAGSTCLPANGWTPRARRDAVIHNGILQEDVVCKSPSAAAGVVMGRQVNGWMLWKTINDEPINIYRIEDVREQPTTLFEKLRQKF